ncbi:hypothetical protein BY458DRAFT_437230 [Sporodiniella umbellata]|nr:hypothetical protein BY458DRAFT_437230 [Sporodiniella umbellata]
MTWLDHHYLSVNAQPGAKATSTNPLQSSSPISTGSSIESRLSPTQQQQNVRFFPEVQNYNIELGKKLRQHTKRRRSSSLPPVFHGRNHKQNNPVVFAPVQVTDPRPIQHTSKAPKIEVPPVAIERAPKKPQPKPVALDPEETQKKLEEQLLHVNFDDVTVAELKEMLKERGLLTTGKKVVLVERLKAARDKLIQSHPSETKQPMLAPYASKEQIDHGWPPQTTQSPALPSFANMTIHSPIPSQDNSLSSVQNDNDTMSIFPSPSSLGYNQDFNVTDIFDGCGLSDDNETLLFPSDLQQEENNLFGFYSNPTNWDQSLDSYLSELA